jgi:hypothetical protein
MQLWQAPYSAGGDQGLLHLAAETLGILPYPHGKYIIYIDMGSYSDGIYRYVNAYL